MTTAEAVVVHSEWLGEVSHDYAGVALPLAGGVVGASVTLLGVPEMAVRTELNQQGTGETFDAADFAVGLTYGRAITDRFSLGGTVKYIQSRVWNSSASSVAVDVGTQFQTDFFGRAHDWRPAVQLRLRPPARRPRPAHVRRPRAGTGGQQRPHPRRLLARRVEPAAGL